jgi:protein-S-isoprenylcysteine O-methyltransferase Ste14
MSLESALMPISAAAWAVVAMLFVYDAKRALWPRIPGEQPWRQARVMGTATAVTAMVVLYRSLGPLWARRTALAVLVIALLVVLRCSIPLKRLVASRLAQPRDS